MKMNDETKGFINGVLTMTLALLLVTYGETMGSRRTEKMFMNELNRTDAIMKYYRERYKDRKDRKGDDNDL